VWIPARVSTNHVGTEPALSEVEGVAKLFVSRGRPRPQIFREGRDLTANQICHRERSKTALSAVSPSRTTPCSSIPAAAHRGILCTNRFRRSPSAHCHGGGSGAPRTRRTPHEGSMHFLACPPTRNSAPGFVSGHGFSRADKTRNHAPAPHGWHNCWRYYERFRFGMTDQGHQGARWQRLRAPTQNCHPERSEMIRHADHFEQSRDLLSMRTSHLWFDTHNRNIFPSPPMYARASSLVLPLPTVILRQRNPALAQDSQLCICGLSQTAAKLVRAV